MNGLTTVSNRLFTAALAEDSGGRRRAPRSEKEVIIELAQREVAQPKPQTAPVAPKEVRFDWRLRA
jgi:hypothetical protein